MYEGDKEAGCWYPKDTLAGLNKCALFTVSRGTLESASSFFREKKWKHQIRTTNSRTILKWIRFYEVSRLKQFRLGLLSYFAWTMNIQCEYLVYGNGIFRFTIRPWNIYDHIIWIDHKKNKKNDFCFRFSINTTTMPMEDRFPSGPLCSHRQISEWLLMKLHTLNIFVFFFSPFQPYIRFALFNLIFGRVDLPCI